MKQKDKKDLKDLNGSTKNLEYMWTKLRIHVNKIKSK